MSDVVVRTFGLSKHYRGSVLALDRAEIGIGRGEVYGFLGLNGAGKTTMIRLLLGMIAPTAGYAELFGRRVRAEAPGLWRRVGHLVESATAYPGLTVRENLELARRLYGVRDRSTLARAIDGLKLGEYADRQTRTLSLGNLQRLALARALLHDPELLILDEPANGLDPAGVVETRELLRTLARERGTTVLMSSHNLTEVDRLATRIGIIHRGRMIEELSAEELERRRNPRLEVGTRDPAAAEAALRKAGYDPRPAPGADQPLFELREQRALDAPEAVARCLVEAGIPVTHLAVAQEDLEQHFLRLTAEGESRKQ
jgi:ABC-2 type transport system ATP-binding protein